LIDIEKFMLVYELDHYTSRTQYFLIAEIDLAKLKEFVADRMSSLDALVVLFHTTKKKL